MRKSKVIKIDDKEITIKELRVRDVYSFVGLEEESSLLDRVEKILPSCSDLSLEKILDMTPSELEIVWLGFKEVNASFLDVAARFGVGTDLLPELVRSIFQEQLAGLSPQDTVG